MDPARPGGGRVASLLVRVLLSVLVVCAASAPTVPTAPAGAATAQDPTSTTVPLPPPAAFVLVDADTGQVLAGSNERERRAPASVSKLVTALVVQQEVEPGDPVPISVAAEGRPARKLNVKAGQVWRASDMLRAMLLCSCNDVAWALAEAAGGSVGGYGTKARALATQLGLADDPVLQDPSGLDDEFSVKGGNRISARDLAIVARAFLADRELAAIVRKPEHVWTGPDGIVHQVTNRNRLFGTYEGAIGVKTGFTNRAGSTFVGAATRGGRTVLVVVLDSQDIWTHSAQLMDLGFATPAPDDADRLPAVPAELGGPVPTTTTAPPTTADTPADGGDDGGAEDEVAGPAQGPLAPGPVGSDADGESVPAFAVFVGAMVLLVVFVAAALRLTRSRRHPRRHGGAHFR